MNKKLVRQTITYTLIFLVLIRLWILIPLTLFFTNSELVTLLVRDKYHHYQFGLILLLFNFLLRKRLKLYFFYLSGLGTALVIDEYNVLLKDLGVNLPYDYLSLADNVILIFLVTILLTFWSYLGKKS